MVSLPKKMSMGDIPLIRKSERIPTAGLKGMNRNEIQSYFHLLESVLKDNELGVDFQLNNSPTAILAKKRSKAVPTITSTKGETVTVIACCSAEEVFLPSTCITKSNNNKTELYLKNHLVKFY